MPVAQYVLSCRWIIPAMLQVAGAELPTMHSIGPGTRCQAEPGRRPGRRAALSLPTCGSVHHSESIGQQDCQRRVVQSEVLNPDRGRARAPASSWAPLTAPRHASGAVVVALGRDRRAAPTTTCLRSCHFVPENRPRVAATGLRPRQSCRPRLDDPQGNRSPESRWSSVPAPGPDVPIAGGRLAALQFARPVGFQVQPCRIVVMLLQN